MLFPRTHSLAHSLVRPSSSCRNQRTRARTTATRYRDREEVANTRSTRDPIENVKRMVLEAGFRTEEEIKAVEKRVRKEVTAAIKTAKASSLPDDHELYTDIFSDGTRRNDGGIMREGAEYQKFTRQVEYVNSLGPDGKPAFA